MENSDYEMPILNIEKLDTFKSGTCPVDKFGGFKWHFEATSINEKKQNERHVLDVKICCGLESDSKIEKLWMCRARVSLNLTYGCRKATKVGEFHFFSGLTSQNWTESLVLTRTNSCIIELEVKLLRHNLDMGTMALETDLELEFNDVKQCLAVNKFTLAGISAYFRNLFFVKWSERAVDEENKPITIKEAPDFDLPAFKLMLYSAMAMGCLAPDGKFLPDEFILPILKLSIKYDVPILQDYCQKYLLDPKAKCHKMDVLVTAEQLGLEQLKDHCLATITSADMGENFGQNVEIFLRLHSHTRELLEKRLDESAKKERRQRKQMENCSCRGGWDSVNSDDERPFGNNGFH